MASSRTAGLAHLKARMVEDGGGCRCRLSPVAHNYSRSLPVTCDIWYFRRKNTTSAKNRRKIDVWQERKLTFNSLTCLFRFIFLLTGSFLTNDLFPPSCHRCHLYLLSFFLSFFFILASVAASLEVISAEILSVRGSCAVGLLLTATNFQRKLNELSESTL